MNPKEFLKILHNPVQLLNEQIFEIEAIVHQFPYFQAARALYLKGLKNLNSIKYNQELKTTAAYTSDRSVLFHYITSDDFFDINLKRQELKIINEIETIDDKVIENLNKETEQENREYSTEKDNIFLDKKSQKEISLPETSDLKDYDISKVSENNTNFLESKQLDTDEDEIKKATFIVEKMEQLLLPSKEEFLLIESNNTGKTKPQDTNEDIRDNLKKQTKTTSELDIENKIELGIKNIEIDIHSNTRKENLFFGIPTTHTEEVTDETQSHSFQKNIESEASDGISINYEIAESTAGTIDNSYGFIFEFDRKESIHPTTEIHSDTNQKKTNTEESAKLFFEPILENTPVEYPEGTNPATEETETKEKEIETPVHFKKDDTHSFNDWLQLSSFKPIDRNVSTSKNDEKEKKQELIDLFINTNPKITPVKPASKNSTIDSYKETPTDTHTVMTETLARIYTKQKKYSNAIKAYEILSLKFPEKSSFFANQIKELKKLKQE